MLFIVQGFVSPTNIDIMREEKVNKDFRRNERIV